MSEAKSEAEPATVCNADLIEKLTRVDDCVRELRKEISSLRSNSFTLNHVIENVETALKSYGESTRLINLLILQHLACCASRLSGLAAFKNLQDPQKLTEIDKNR